MATRGTPRNGRDRLNVAMAHLVRHRATSADQRAELARQREELDRTAAARFARIETGLADILHILEQQSRMLERMPDAICEALGYVPRN